jgi:hypothetical protein
MYVLEWKYLVALMSCPVIKKIGPIGTNCAIDAA